MRGSKISAHYDEIARCNRCGFCQTACPVFRATGHEAGVARGRLALLRALVEGRLGWTRELEEPLFACLLCGACTSHCFPAVPTADLVVAAREEYLARVGKKSLHRMLFEKLLPYPRRMRSAARAAALGQKSGLFSVVQALGLLKIFGRDLPRILDILGPVPGKAFRENAPPGVLEGKGKGLSIGFFVGCGMDIMSPRAAEATMDLLREKAKKVHVLDNVCCGLPAGTYGDAAAARKLAEMNLEVLDSGDFDLIVTDCSSCASYLKKYPALFPEERALREKAKRVASRVRDLVEVAGGSAPSSEGMGEGMVVTYHDPCHASRGQGLRAEPRALLASLPGVEYRELREADWCCGGAGSYALSHYDLAMKVLHRKMDNLERSGANVLATSCPACILHLSYGVRLRGLPVRVQHLSEVIRDHGAEERP